MDLDIDSMWMFLSASASLFHSKGVSQADQNVAGSQEGSENVLIKIISFLSAKNDLKTILVRGALLTLPAAITNT